MHEGAWAASRHAVGDFPSGRVITANAMLSSSSERGTMTTFPIAASPPSAAAHWLETVCALTMPSASRLPPPTSATVAPLQPTSLSTDTLRDVAVRQPTTVHAASSAGIASDGLMVREVELLRADAL
jgi:hypothetical protein